MDMRVAFREGTYTVECGHGTATVHVPNDVMADGLRFAAERILEEVGNGKTKSDAA